MLWIVGTIVLLAIGGLLVVVGFYLFSEDSIGGGFLFIILGGTSIFLSYDLTYDQGHGIPAKPNDLDKKIIYIFRGQDRYRAE